MVGIVPDELPALLPQPTPLPTATPLPAPDLNIREQDVVLSQPLAEGVPFTATVMVRNLGDVAAERVQVLLSVVRTATTGEQNIVVGSATSGPITARALLPVAVVIAPVVALVPGEYHYHASVSIIHGPADRNLRNNAAPVGMFALAPPLHHCSGTADLALGQKDVLLHGQVMDITIHNNGPETLYNVQLIVHSLDDIPYADHAYHVARVLPCGGIASLAAFRPSGKLVVEVNPVSSVPVTSEANHSNNQVIVDGVD
ncbi:MAG: hypothetical protein H0X37_03400 [Herpetosiphonaceae bacterium]|nr:hypothetical protein [Herpetosiphonaceae bacterium]